MEPFSEIQNPSKYHGWEFKGNCLKVEHLSSLRFSKRENCLFKNVSTVTDWEGWWKWPGCPSGGAWVGVEGSACPALGKTSYMVGGWGGIGGECLRNLLHFKGENPKVTLKSPRSNLRSTQEGTPGSASNMTFKKITLTPYSLNKAGASRTWWFLSMFFPFHHEHLGCCHVTVPSLGGHS